MAVNQHASVVGVGEIMVAADPQTVWDVLTAIERWPSWNPDVETMSLHGPVAEGTQFQWRSGPQKLTSTILRLERPWLFAWSGKTRGVHTTKVWRLQPQAGRTIVKAEESWQGLLPRLLPRLMQRTLDSALDAELGHLQAEAERRSTPGPVELAEPPRPGQAASAGPADLGGPTAALLDGPAVQSAADGDLPWPKGWSRPATVEAMAWPMAVFGICALVAAPTVAAADLQLVRAIGLGLFLGGVGAGMLLAASVLLARRDAPPRLATVDDGGLARTGVVLPYARAQVVRLIAARVGWCVSGMGLPLLVGWWGLVLGAAALLGGAVAVAGPLRRGAGRGWQLVLLPEGVLYMQGPARALLGWQHILEVRAVPVSTRTGFSPPQKLGLLVDTWVTPLEPALVEQLGRWNIDISALDVGTLAVDPLLAYAALRFYAAHPEARAELGDQRGVQRLLLRDLG